MLITWCGSSYAAYMLEAVATATRCTPVAKKSRYDNTANSPPARRHAAGCSCDSFSSACV